MWLEFQRVCGADKIFGCALGAADLHVLIDIAPPERRNGSESFLLLSSGSEVYPLVGLSEPITRPAARLIDAVNVGCAEGSEPLPAEHSVPEHERLGAVGRYPHAESDHRLVPRDFRLSVVSFVAQRFDVGLCQYQGFGHLSTM